MDEKENGEKEFILRAGFACGWGSGADSLTITHQTISYQYFIPRISQKPQFSKSRAITAKEWEMITESFNFDQFILLKYNTCNICFDGCDEWIDIQKNKVEYKITFTKGLKIDSISGLQAALSQLRSEFNN